MNRRAIIGISAVIALVLVIALFTSIRFRSADLTPAELASRQPSPPRSFADDCSEIRRGLANTGDKTVENTAPLSADEVGIYRSVIQRWMSNARKSLNVSGRTFPLDETSSRLSECECLTGIEVQSIVSAAHTFRTLTQDVLPAKNMRLVHASTQGAVVESNDPGSSIKKGKPVKGVVGNAFATGLFSLSEIAFDNQHRRALVSYSFVCGSLCGNGGTLLFEKVDGGWKRSDRICGGWIS
jgi:hypothetical protein